MKICLEPTETVCTGDELKIDPSKFTARVWIGWTQGGVRIEAYVLTVVPNEKQLADFIDELPPFMFRTRKIQML